MSDDKPAAGPAEETSRLGKFIVRYHTFLSSFVIGAAGLVATSIWQFRQAETAQRQSEAQQKVAETQAENSWKIERAEILGKNLSVLASSGSNSADQRYGVLLSLTRADIIDPELTISYALELGKDNADYMQSVLANVTRKDYVRLNHAYVLSCDEKYGVSPAIDSCADVLAARSAAIGRIIADDVEAALAAPPPVPVPGVVVPAAPRPSALALLKDERTAQLNVLQLCGLFETALTELYERRQWDDLARFAGYSPGAHLVSSLVLAAARTGELATEDENKLLDKFHDDQTKWLSDYLMSKACDAECKGRIIEVMISKFEESQGDYDLALRKLLESPRSQSGAAVSHLHARLLWCQIGDSDLVPLRDHVMVPAAMDLLKSTTADPETSGALVGLLAATPAPDPEDAKAAAAWAQVMAQVDKLGEKVDKQKPSHAFKTMKDRRASVARQRQNPPRALKKLNFCTATADAAEDAGSGNL